MLAVPRHEGVEQRLLDPVRAAQLTAHLDDVALVVVEVAGVGPGAGGVDGGVTQARGAGGRDVDRPLVRGVVLVGNGEDGELVQGGADDGVVVRVPEGRQEARGESGALEHDRERPADASTFGEDRVPLVLPLRWELGLVGDGRDACHDSLRKWGYRGLRRDRPAACHGTGFIVARPGRHGNDHEAQRTVARCPELEVRANRDRQAPARGNVHDLFLAAMLPPHLACALEEVPDLLNRPVGDRQ